ncbi:MAG: hypothetical protein HRU22_12590 [Gammaproteobacteria bacterium]|nr:hypothetical protein [Gammaproteobacteria bacterium]
MMFRFNQMLILISVSLTLLPGVATANDIPWSLDITNDYSFVNSGAIDQHKSSNRILFDGFSPTIAAF